MAHTLRRLALTGLILGPLSHVESSSARNSIQGGGSKANSTLRRGALGDTLDAIDENARVLEEEVELSTNATNITLNNATNLVDAFDSPACSLVEIEILTDSWGAETFWSLFSEEGDTKTWLAGRNETDEEYTSNTLYKYAECIELGSYLLAMGDSYGDGIFQGGYFVLAVEDTLIKNGTFTGTGENIFFQVPYDGDALIESAVTPTEPPVYAPVPTGPPVPDLGGEPRGLVDACLFQFEIETDAYGNEISWKLISETTAEVIASIDDNTYGSHQSYIFNQCLTYDTYRFTIFDVLGDGIGSYRVLLGGELLKEGGDAFALFQNETVVFTYEPDAPTMSPVPSASPTETMAPSVSLAPTGSWVSGNVVETCLGEYATLQSASDIYGYMNLTEARVIYISQLVSGCAYAAEYDGPSCPFTVEHTLEESGDDEGSRTLVVQVNGDFSPSQTSSIFFEHYATMCYMNGGRICTTALSFDVEMSLTPSYEFYDNNLSAIFTGEVSGLPICTPASSDTCSDDDFESLAAAELAADFKSVYDYFFRYNSGDQVELYMYELDVSVCSVGSEGFSDGSCRFLSKGGGVECRTDIGDWLKISSLGECTIDTYGLLHLDEELNQTTTSYFDMVQDDCSDPDSLRACSPHPSDWYQDDPFVGLNVTNSTVSLDFTATGYNYGLATALTRFDSACRDLGFGMEHIDNMDIAQLGNPDTYFEIKNLPVCLPPTCSAALALEEAIPEWPTCVMYGDMSANACSTNITRLNLNGTNVVADDAACRDGIERMRSDFNLVAGWNGLAVVALQSCLEYGGSYYPDHSTLCRHAKDYGDEVKISSEMILDFEEFNGEAEYENYETACIESNAGIEAASFCEAWISISFNQTANGFEINESIQIKGFPMCYAPSCNDQFDEPLVDELMLPLIENFFIAGVDAFMGEGGRRLATPKLTEQKGGISAALSRVLHLGTAVNRELQTPNSLLASGQVGESVQQTLDYYPHDDAYGYGYGYSGLDLELLRFECKSMNGDSVSSQAPTGSPISLF